MKRATTLLLLMLSIVVSTYAQRKPPANMAGNIYRGVAAAGERARAEAMRQQREAARQQAVQRQQAMERQQMVGAHVANTQQQAAVLNQTVTADNYVNGANSELLQNSGFQASGQNGVMTPGGQQRATMLQNNGQMSNAQQPNAANQQAVNSIPTGEGYTNDRYESPFGIPKKQSPSQAQPTRQRPKMSPEQLGTQYPRKNCIVQNEQDCNKDSKFGADPPAKKQEPTITDTAGNPPSGKKTGASKPNGKQKERITFQTEPLSNPQRQPQPSTVLDAARANAQWLQEGADLSTYFKQGYPGGMRF
ncbi:MAG: hypothetical protein IJ710_01165 [Prevotella sp.]|nr:hypothetical protein [Prevotella sp.]